MELLRLTTTSDGVVCGGALGGGGPGGAKGPPKPMNEGGPIGSCGAWGVIMGTLTLAVGVGRSEEWSAAPVEPGAENDSVCSTGEQR